MTDIFRAQHPRYPDRVIVTGCIGPTWSFRIETPEGHRLTGGGGFNNADDARQRAHRLVDWVMGRPGWGF
jgi:hypothetical protein